jgi:hypothetical protein
VGFIAGILDGSYFGNSLVAPGALARRRAEGASLCSASVSPFGGPPPSAGHCSHHPRLMSHENFSRSVILRPLRPKDPHSAHASTLLVGFSTPVFRLAIPLCSPQSALPRSALALPLLSTCFSIAFSSIAPNFGIAPDNRSPYIRAWRRFSMHHEWCSDFGVPFRHFFFVEMSTAVTDSEPVNHADASI